MFSSVKSFGVSGIGGYGVSVEVYISNGLPSFDVVGLPDAAVREARERVRAAIKNNGFRFPVSRMTVNLAPADKKKAGTLYDLPILVGILAAAGDIEPPRGDAAFIGELSLLGELRAVVDDDLHVHSSAVVRNRDLYALSEILFAQKLGYAVLEAAAHACDAFDVACGDARYGSEDLVCKSYFTEFLIGNISLFHIIYLRQSLNII